MHIIIIIIIIIIIKLQLDFHPVLIVQEAGWAPRPVWTGAENLAPHWDSITGPSSL
jgi:hypothetical protein